MLFKKDIDTEILKALTVEFPDLSLDPKLPNIKRIISAGKAQAEQDIEQYGAKSHMSRLEYIHVYMYYIALEWLQFIGYNGCLGRDKNLLEFVRDQCVLIHPNVQRAVGEGKIPGLVALPLTYKSTILAGVSHEAIPLIDSSADADQLWESLVARVTTDLENRLER